MVKLTSPSHGVPDRPLTTGFTVWSFAFSLKQEAFLFPGFAFLYHKREMCLIRNGAQIPFYAYHELTLIRLEKLGVRNAFIQENGCAEESFIPPFGKDGSIKGI